ncbi:MAG: hypothetical protein K0R54_660 [Clostridiaceae bacterium]|jgi:hypothetical protein|nr:hypothetical protein [Clostridiaceae bacterium]
MRPKQITESELFIKLNLLLLDRNKEHLNELTDMTSLISNVVIDSSGFLRGAIEYFYENQSELEKLAPYVENYKGYNVLNLLNQLIAQNVSIEEMSEKTGIGQSIIEKAMEKLPTKNK